MAWQVIRDAQRLPSHLAAGFAQFARRFHGVEHFIERQAWREIFACRGSPRADAVRPHRWGRRSLRDMRAETLRLPRIAHFAGLHAGLEAERVRIGPRGKEAVRKLKQAKKSIHVDAVACFRWDRKWPGGAPRARPAVPSSGPSLCRPAPEFCSSSQRQGKMAVADFKRNLHRFVVIRKG